MHVAIIVEMCFYICNPTKKGETMPKKGRMHVVQPRKADSRSFTVERPKERGPGVRARIVFQPKHRDAKRARQQWNKLKATRNNDVESG